MPGPALEMEPVEPQSLKKLSFKSLKRALDLFSPVHGQIAPPDPESEKMRISYKVCSGFSWFSPGNYVFLECREAVLVVGALVGRLIAGLLIIAGPFERRSGFGFCSLISSTEEVAGVRTRFQSGRRTAPRRIKANKLLGLPMRLLFRVQKVLEIHQWKSHKMLLLLRNDVGLHGKGTAIVSASGSSERNLSTLAIMGKIPSRWPHPVWHPPWKNYRVISGHLGWVRSIGFDPSNQCFCAGSADMGSSQRKAEANADRTY